MITVREMNIAIAEELKGVQDVLLAATTFEELYASLDAVCQHLIEVTMKSEPHQDAFRTVTCIALMHVMRGYLTARRVNRDDAHALTIRNEMLEFMHKVHSEAAAETNKVAGQAVLQ